MWRTFRKFTNMPQELSTCDPDTQWEHWFQQGHIVEDVWSDALLDPAKSWCDRLRETSVHIASEPRVAFKEAEECRKQVKPGKAAGKDGVPSDVIQNLPALTLVMHLVFSIMFTHAVYPVAWGTSLLRALLKPGKPKSAASSLRGIRLASSMASWFGRIFDKRARAAWQPGNEQFGFRSNTGCSEAVALLLALVLSRTMDNKRLFVLWVDLRTAFPSLSRPILIRKMFQCGIGLGLCRLMLAILDVTSTMVCIGNLVGNTFKDVLGVREGAVESPNAFNMYIGDLRGFLENLHPSLCRLMGVTLAVILYADDAALPADSLEDLQLLASLFERFCNDNRLFISTPKTFVTVFHPASDQQVIYEQDKVFVDGVQVRVQIYGQEIGAAASFKYLGVVLNSTCTYQAHADSRETSFERAAYLLLAGLSRIPAYPQSFLLYLWSALVKPVMCYGMDVFAYPACYVDAFRARERKWWRKLLQVGGRSPNAAVQALFGDTGCDVTWRGSRASLLLKLLNSPTGSWQQLAAIAHHHLRTPWFVAALADLHLVLPGVALLPTVAGGYAYLSSSGAWSDESSWLSFHAFRLPVNLNGCRYRPSRSSGDAFLSKCVRAHVKHVVHSLRVALLRRKWQDVYEELITSSTASASSKLAILARRLQMPGPPLHMALDAIPLPSHRGAMCSLFCADWALGVHAHNYYAKQLLPHTLSQLRFARDSVTDVSSICLPCWHFRRVAVIEDEFHIMCSCPEYQGLRDELQSHTGIALNTQVDMMQALSGHDKSRTQAVGKFLFQLRQRRRKMKLLLERYNHQIETQAFAVRKAAWRFKGKHCCRHGVFFSQRPEGACKCMDVASSVASDWQYAQYMPRLDEELKAIVVARFHLPSYARLTTLQSRARQLEW